MLFRSSLATNWYSNFGTTGTTNSSATKTRKVIGVTGSSVIITNWAVVGLGFSRGTITVAQDIDLPPGWALVGTSCACVTNIDW